MPEPLGAPVPQDVFSDIPHAFMGVGEDADVDAAFDDAAGSARFEYGHAGLLPSLATADPGGVQREDTPLPRARALVLARRILLDSPTPGAVYAIPLTADSAWRRRRIAVPFDDPALPLPASARVLSHLPEELESSLLSLAPEAPAEDELVEVADLRRVRARYKPVAESHPGKSLSRYVVTLKGSDVPLAEGATAGEARRAAVALARAGAVEGLEEYELEISQRTRRLDGNPHVTVKRTRVTQKGQVRLTYAALKNPEKVKVAAWLFFGVQSEPSLTDPAEAQSGTQSGDQPEAQPEA